RPKQVKDVAHQDEVVRVLSNTLETSNCPHMLFYGPPGTGKTTTALAIAHQLFGPELYKSRVLELNASDDRGINVVRTKIKNFAAVAVGSSRQGGYPCPPFKIIILDEADSMTQDAQNALRRTMETYSKVTRFFFICNYISRIIEPLASRCAKFRFKPLTEEIMGSRILHICKEEGLNLDSEALSTLSSISQGDLRRAITYLQSAARLFGSSISAKDLISVSGVIPNEVVQAIFSACRSGNFDLANKEVNNVIAEGYPVSQMLSQLYDIVVDADNISDEQKARICKKFAEADKCLVDGADEYLQLLNVASSTMQALSNMPQDMIFDDLTADLDRNSGIREWGCVNQRRVAGNGVIANGMFPARSGLPMVRQGLGEGEKEAETAGGKVFFGDGGRERDNGKGDLGMMHDEN
ncbi:Replication factor C subunit 4, partial [Capsicum baccatum]